MVKFTHMSNYSDLMGFTIFKCGSGFTPDQKIVIALRLVKRGGLKLNL